MASSTTTAESVGSPARMIVEGGVATIRLDQPGKPVNVLSRGMVEALSELLEELEAGAGGARAAVIASEKPGIWIAGADIEEFTEFRTAADAERASRAGQALLDRIEHLQIPTVAAIDGAALGGGLELALACTYRIATSSPKTKLGFPEVQLGILPGAGGTQRLPRLIGLRSALDLMLTGKQLDARRARKLGLVDKVVPPEVLPRVAEQVALELAAGDRSPRGARRRGTPDRMEQFPGVKQLVLRKAREGVMQKTHGLYPAPLRILDVVDHGVDRSLEEGLDLEAKAFGQLAVTPEARALVHLFFATTAAKNAPELAVSGSAADEPGAARVRPLPVDHVAVVGAGFMGAGIATVAAESGISVRLKDVSTEAAGRGLRTARDSLLKRARRRRRAKHEIRALVDRISVTHQYTGFGRVDLVVEAVFEDLELKHRVVREIEAATPPETILGTNTSTIPIARIAEASERPEQLVGLHFFSPVEKMPLLEIIVHPGTAPRVAATGHRFGKRIGKTPIVVNDAPGFYVNRILSPYMAEAALLLDEGVRIEQIDGAMTAWGFPVGPITLYDEVGLDVALRSGNVMAEAHRGRFQPSDTVARLVEDGRLGRKNSRGFYRYEDGKRTDADEAVYALIGNPSKADIPRSDIQERLALLMINEAVRTLEEGVLRSARDGDVGAVLGIGFPPFRGGPFWYVDRTGAAAVLARLRAREAEHGARFAPSPLLVRMADAGEKFFDGGAGAA